MPPHERSPSPTPSLEASPPPPGDACTSPVRQHEEMMAVVSSHFHMEDLEYEVEMDEDDEDEEVTASSGRSVPPTYQSRLDDTEATFLIETLTESMMDDDGGVDDEVDFHQLGRGKNSPTVAAAASTASDHVTPKRQVRQRRPSTGGTGSKSVSFHRVHVREYNQVLGDHPCCTNGPPVSLGWEHTQYDAVCFERYETARLDAPKRTRRQLKMNADARREVLRKQAQKQADAATAAATSSQNDSGRRSPDSAVQNLLDEDEENDLLLEDAIMSSNATGGNGSKSLESSSAEEIRRAEQRLMRVKERHQTLTGFVYDTFFPSPTAEHSH